MCSKAKDPSHLKQDLASHLFVVKERQAWVQTRSFPAPLPQNKDELTKLLTSVSSSAELELYLPQRSVGKNKWHHAWRWPAWCLAYHKLSEGVRSALIYTWSHLRLMWPSSHRGQHSSKLPEQEQQEPEKHTWYQRRGFKPQLRRVEHRKQKIRQIAQFLLWVSVSYCVT